VNDRGPLTSAALAARYENVRRTRTTTSLAPDRWADLDVRSRDRPWGVGICCTHAGRLLLVCENDEWLLPGGLLEPGESPATGARRETREETGVDAAITGLGAIVDRTFVNRATDECFRFSFATFLGTTTDPTTSADPGLDGEGIDAVRWVEAVPENTFDRDLVISLFEATADRTSGSD
jgi:8-oxo-dGTP diphosphatase